MFQSDAPVLRPGRRYPSVFSYWIGTIQALIIGIRATWGEISSPSIGESQSPPQRHIQGHRLAGFRGYSENQAGLRVAADMRPAATTLTTYGALQRRG
jgi:hypothetical protein